LGHAHRPDVAARGAATRGRRPPSAPDAHGRARRGWARGARPVGMSPAPRQMPAGEPCFPLLPGPLAPPTPRPLTASATPRRVVLHHLLLSSRRPRRPMARLRAKAEAPAALPARATGRSAMAAAAATGPAGPAATAAAAEGAGARRGTLVRSVAAGTEGPSRGAAAAAFSASRGVLRMSGRCFRLSAPSLLPPSRSPSPPTGSWGALIPVPLSEFHQRRLAAKAAAHEAATTALAAAPAAAPALAPVSAPAVSPVAPAAVPAAAPAAAPVAAAAVPRLSIPALAAETVRQRKWARRPHLDHLVPTRRRPSLPCGARAVRLGRRLCRAAAAAAVPCPRVRALGASPSHGHAGPSPWRGPLGGGLCHGERVAHHYERDRRLFRPPPLAEWAVDRFGPTALAQGDAPKKASLRLLMAAWPPVP